MKGHDTGQLAIRLLLAERKSSGELNAIATHVEDDKAGPRVGVPSGRPSFEAKLDDHGEDPDRDQTEPDHWRLIDGAIDNEHNHFLRHASDGVEGKVACK